MEKTFSQKLKDARKSTGLSQRKLADALNISRRNIENWESGTRVPDQFKQESILLKLEDMKMSLEEIKKFNEEIVNDEQWEKINESEFVINFENCGYSSQHQGGYIWWCATLIDNTEVNVYNKTEQ